MMRIAILLFGLVATVFAGIAIVIVLMVPAWQIEARKYIVGAIALGVVLAVPATLFIARQIASFTGKAN